jgi:hypothetical protein
MSAERADPFRSSSLVGDSRHWSATALPHTRRTCDTSSSHRHYGRYIELTETGRTPLVEARTILAQVERAELALSELEISDAAH